jgi:hypothetical protein
MKFGMYNPWIGFPHYLKIGANLGKLAEDVASGDDGHDAAPSSFEKSKGFRHISSHDSPGTGASALRQSSGGRDPCCPPDKLPACVAFLGFNHHRREGLCSEIVSVVLPEKFASRSSVLWPSAMAKRLKSLASEELLT